MKGRKDERGCSKFKKKDKGRTWSANRGGERKRGGLKERGEREMWRTEIERPQSEGVEA